MIVGGGLAGLSTGCYALMNGFDAVIVEHNLALGGVCTAWQRGPYTVDGCIHWLTGGAFQQLYQELHIVPPVELHTLDQFMTYLDARSGTQVVLGRDLDRLGDDLRALSPADSAAIEGLVHAARSFAELRPPIGDPAELESGTARLRELWEMRHQLGTVFSFRKSVAQWTEAHLQSAVLRRVLRRIATDEAPMFVVLMILGYLGRGWLSRPVGGTASFRDALVKRYEQLGGEARVNTTVEEIVVEKDRARGVRLTDGTLLEGEAVVSTSSMPETVLRLLGGRYGAEVTRRRLAEWKLFDPIALVSFGVAAPLANVPPTLMVDGIAPFDVGGVPNDHLYVRIFNEGPGFAPAGHTVVQLLLGTGYDWWAMRGSGYNAAKDAVAATALEHLVEHLPAMRGHIEMTDVATPLTYWRTARSWRGAYEGWHPSGRDMLGHVEKKLPGLRDFYMAGQWVEPGGGVPTALLSGRQAVQLLCDETHRSFSPSERAP